MKLSDSIIGHLLPFVKGVRARYWRWRERRALETLAESWRYIGTPTLRYLDIIRSMRPPGVHSEAWKKGSIVHCGPALTHQLSRMSFDDN